jgi:calcineurin-like phosphoesterase family protein
MKRIFLALIALSFLAASPAKATRFAVLGHMYPITEDRERLLGLIQDVNEKNPEYVFILGDSNAWKKATYETLSKRFKGKVYFVPGNHDVKKEKKAKYLKNVAYMSNHIETKDANFLLFYSGLSLENVQKYLKDQQLIIRNDKPLILMTHHRIWDDNLISSGAFRHDKSYKFEEIYPLIKNRVKYIFAGNSNRQYFGHSATNTNVIYWVEKFRNITCIACGMGNAKPKATYIVADYKNGDMDIEPYYFKLKSDPNLPSAGTGAKESSGKSNDGGGFFSDLFSNIIENIGTESAN